MKLMHEHPENHLQFIAQNEHLCKQFSSFLPKVISAFPPKAIKSLHLSLHPTGRHSAYCICSPSLQVSPASKLAQVKINGKNDRSIPEMTLSQTIASNLPKKKKATDLQVSFEDI